MAVIKAAPQLSAKTMDGTKTTVYCPLALERMSLICEMADLSPKKDEFIAMVKDKLKAYKIVKSQEYGEEGYITS